MLKCAENIKEVGKGMKKLADKLSGSKNQAIEQLELSRNFWGGILGFLLAVYVSLSFVSVSVSSLSP